MPSALTATASAGKFANAPPCSPGAPAAAIAGAGGSGSNAPAGGEAGSPGTDPDVAPPLGTRRVHPARVAAPVAYRATFRVSPVISWGPDQVMPTPASLRLRSWLSTSVTVNLGAAECAARYHESKSDRSLLPVTPPSTSSPLCSPAQPSLSRPRGSPSRLNSRGSFMPSITPLPLGTVRQLPTAPTATAFAVRTANARSPPAASACSLGASFRGSPRTLLTPTAPASGL